MIWISQVVIPINLDIGCQKRRIRRESLKPVQALNIYCWNLLRIKRGKNIGQFFLLLNKKKFSEKVCDIQLKRELNRIVTPIKVDKLQELLCRTGYDTRKTDFIIDGFKNGFDIGYRGPRRRRHTSENIPFSVGNKFDLLEKINKEVEAGRVCEPFSEIPYRYYVQSPVGLVPKSGEWTRMIFHLSFDFGVDEDSKSINYHTPEELNSVKYKDLDHTIKNSLRLLDQIAKRENRVANLFYSKSDLRNAFHLIPVMPTQCYLLIMKVNDPITGRPFFFVERALPFGASISCKTFQIFSDCLLHIVETVMGFSNHCSNYLDDYIFFVR